MALTVDQVRQHVSTPLEDEALGRLLAAAYDAIAEYIGDGTTHELISAGETRLMLSRPASEITDVVEGTTTLAEDDYELIGNQTLRRLATGTHPRRYWRGVIEVTYTTTITDATRDRVATELVKLDAGSDRGIVSERTGDHSVTYSAGVGAVDDEREAILLSLFGQGAAFV